MNTTIWRYPILTEGSVIEMPVGAVFLCVQLQNNVPTLWLSVNPDAKKEKRYFRFYETGGTMPAGLTYRGTVQINMFVWHLYEETGEGHIETLGGVDGKETIS